MNLNYADKFFHWWSVAPVMRCFIPFVCGVFCFQFGQSFFWLILFCSFSLFFLHRFTDQLDSTNQNLFLLCTLLLFFLLGKEWSFQWYRHEPVPNLSYDGVFHGKVRSFKLKEKWSQIILDQVLVVRETNNRQEIKGGVVLYVKHIDERYLAGDELVFQGNIEPVRAQKIPLSFDFKKYLWTKNIYFQSYISNQKVCKISSKPGRFVETLRTRISQVIERHLTTDQTKAVAKALLLGQKDDLDQSIKDAYRDAGAMHVLAVSGLHVGIIASVFLLFLFPLRYYKPERIRYLRITAIGAIWVFAYICNWSPSVSRAAIMLSVFLFGTSFFESYVGLNVLAIAGFILLLYHPKYVYDIGFQFSFLAVLGILLSYSALVEFVHFGHKLFRYVWRLVALTLSAQLFLFPLLLYYFHQFPLYFIPNSIVAVFAVFVIISTSFVIVAYDLVFQSTFFLSNFLEFCIDGLNRILTFTSSLPVSTIDDIWIDKFQLLILFLVSVCICMFLVSRQSMWLGLSFFCIFLFVIANGITKIQKESHDYLILYAERMDNIDFVRNHSLYRFVGRRHGEKANNYESLAVSSYFDTDSTIVVKMDSIFKTSALHFYRGILALEDSIVLILSNANVDFVLSLRPSCFDLVVANCQNQDLEMIIERHKVNKVILQCESTNPSGRIIRI